MTFTAWRFSYVTLVVGSTELSLYGQALYESFTAVSLSLVCIQSFELNGPIYPE